MEKPLYGQAIIIAHRGASAIAPENTLAAFRAAAASGGWLELAHSAATNGTGYVVVGGRRSQRRGALMLYSVFLLALRSVQREAVMSDPAWSRGNYADNERGPQSGMRIARKLGISGTPTFIIGNRIISGASRGVLVVEATLRSMSLPVKPVRASVPITVLLEGTANSV